MKGEQRAPKFALKSLGKPFVIFMIIMSIFDLGNSSDAFLILRAQERGLSVIGILLMLMVFNLIYALLSAPAGGLSDRVGRRRLITAGWLVYAAIYLGFGLAVKTWHIVALFISYGFIMPRHIALPGICRRSCPGECTRDSLWHLQCSTGHIRFPCVSDRRRTLAGSWQMGGIWRPGALLIWRQYGIDCQYF